MAYSTTEICIQLNICLFASLKPKKIVHRDIKSHNVLLDEKLGIKLCDFGLARHIVIQFFIFLILFKIV